MEQDCLIRGLHSTLNLRAVWAETTNTVNAGIANHKKYDAILRNHYMRTSPQDLGVLTNLAAMTTWQNSKIDQISTQSLAKGANCFLSYLKKKSWFNCFAKKIKSEGGK